MASYFDFCRQFLSTWYGCVVVALLLYFFVFHKLVKRFLLKHNFLKQKDKEDLTDG
ncbi:hypothetical protein FACS189490_07890 [Clostridia bacterium]|nr:hypothetical protein FACS189490_07890 [Clostridia bacterium]